MSFAQPAILKLRSENQEAPATNRGFCFAQNHPARPPLSVVIPEGNLLLLLHLPSPLLFVIPEGNPLLPLLLLLHVPSSFCLSFPEESAFRFRRHSDPQGQNLRICFLYLPATHLNPYIY